MTNKRPRLELLTQKGKLPAGESRTVDLLVRICPPAADQTNGKRPQLNLSMVLDRSGSMQGRKISEAREAAKYCIDQLLSTDRISTVIFDDNVEVLIASQLVENKELLKRSIGSVQTAGSTALHEAWVRGGLQVSDFLVPEAINRVLLITDGQANVGETSVDRIVGQARQLAGKGVSTSTIGIGEDFNEDLLMPMAEAGQGNSWHVQEPQDMVRIFETELKGLIAQIGHTVRLTIKPHGDVKVVDVLNDLETDGHGRYQLPNLQTDSPLDLVVRLLVPTHESGDTAKLIDVDLSYIDQGSRSAANIGETFEIGFDMAATVDQLPENGDVSRAVQLLMNARARREAIESLDRGELDVSLCVLSSAADETDVLFSATPSPALASERDELKELAESLRTRENDVMARKRMAYGRESIRKGK